MSCIGPGAPSCASSLGGVPALRDDHLYGLVGIRVEQRVWRHGPSRSTRRPARGSRCLASTARRTVRRPSRSRYSRTGLRKTLPGPAPGRKPVLHIRLSAGGRRVLETLRPIGAATAGGRHRRPSTQEAHRRATINCTQADMQETCSRDSPYPSSRHMRHGLRPARRRTAGTLLSVPMPEYVVKELLACRQPTRGPTRRSLRLEADRMESWPLGSDSPYGLCLVSQKGRSAPVCR